MKKKKAVKRVLRPKKPSRLKAKTPKAKPSPKKKTVSPRGFRPQLKIYADAPTLFSEAAHLMMETARQAVAERGRFMVALSGGSTPKGLFQQLAEEPYYSLMPWAKTFVFWVDERHVPLTDETSNYRMTNENLLSKVPIPKEQIFPGTDPARSVQDSAVGVEKKLKQTFGSGATPLFDFCLMGMGDDGHTASLFPGMPQLNEQEKWVVGYFVDDSKKERVSLTFPVLNAARLLAVLAEGPKKSEMLKKVLEGPSDPPRYPIQYLRPSQGRLIFLMDRAAAALLKKK